MTFDYDLFVIGAGSGGVRAARIAATAGARVAVAEEYRVGGTCVIRGCVPKKLLVYASEFGRAFHEAEGYGWRAGAPSFDWKTLIANKDREIDRLNAAYIKNLKGAGAEIIASRAVLKDAHTVHLTAENRDVTADRILIATGARPSIDETCPGHELGVTSNEVFHLDKLPRHVVIAGAGYIAVEFACILRGLGSEVSLVYRGDRILKGFDRDVSAQVAVEMERSGVKIVLNTVFKGIEGVGADGRRVSLTNGTSLDCDLVLWAIGRRPNTEGLGLEAAGVKLDKGAVVVDAQSRSTVDNIYAVGDVTDRLALTPVAIREGAAFADAVFRNRPTKVDYAFIPTAVFSQPPVGTIGYTEERARALFRKVDIYRTDFRPMKNTLSGSMERTLMKLVVDGESDRVLGVHIVGEGAPEMIQCLAIAVKAGVTKAGFDDTVALHPTAAEELVLMREKAAG
ncbi:MAG: glutathione-disulfide reductase [Parvularculaceae bacterium]